MSVIGQIFSNRFVILPLVVGVIVQVYKFFFYFIKTGKPDFQWLTATGGMPSSHTASVMALSTLVGLKEGFNSPIFGVSLFFSLIIMYDAAGLRRAAGQQAEVINRILEEFSEFHRIREERLKELLGHTPMEVIVGAVVGILFALLFSSIMN